MSDPIDIVERLAGMSADHGPDGWPAVQMRDITALCAEITCLRAALAAWEDTLTAVMPADFKDWHQNSRSEWPAVAAGVITALRADRDEGWRLAAQVPQPVAAPEWVDAVMDQAQVFASAWSLVGGRFDFGRGLEEAEIAKQELRAMLAAAPHPQAPADKRGGE